jgi:hypothetical protein
MNKGIVKIIVAILVVIGVLFGGLSYYISTQIKPEEIRQIIVKGINDALPGAEAQLKEVDYGIGASVKLYLNEFNLRSKANQKKLVGFKEAEVKIPLLAILTGGGTITLKVDSPELNVRTKTYGGTNWDGVFPEVDQVKNEVQDENKKEQNKITIPSFLKGTKIDVAINNTNLNLKQGINPESLIKVEKVRLKNLNLKDASAFEILTNVKYSLDKKTEFKTRIQIVGELNIAKFLEDKNLEVNVRTNLKNTSMTGLPLSVPDIKVIQKVSIDKEGVINLKNNINLGAVMDSASTVELKKDVITVKDLETKIKIQEAINLLNDELKSSLSMIDASAAEVLVKGVITVNSKTMKISPALKIDMPKPVIVKSSGVEVKSTMKGDIKGVDYKFTLLNSLFNGSISADVKTKFDLSNIPSDLDKFNKIYVTSNMTNLKIKKEALQEILYGGEKKEVKVDSETGEVIAPEGSLITLPPVDIYFKGSNNFIADQKFNLSGSISAKGQNIKSNDLKFNYGSGYTAIEFKTYLRDSVSIYNNFTAKLVNMNFIGLHPFLPKGLDRVSGSFKGSAGGKLDLLPTQIKYDLDLSFDAKNGEFDRLDVASYLKPLVDKVDALKGKADDIIPSGKFDIFTLNAKATERIVKIKRMKFVGQGKSGTFQADGHISMVDGPSKMKVTLTDPKNLAALKKETGRAELPIMLKGQGFVPLPDVGYTVGELTKRAAKNQVKKQTKKVEKEIKKKAEKEIKKLFKGIKF